MFDLEEWAFGQDKLSQKYLQNKFNKLVDSEKSVKAKLAQHVPEVKKKSRLQVAKISEIIES